VGFELPADPGDPGHPNTSVGRLDESRAVTERRLVRDGVQVLAHGAFVCPSCGIPIAVSVPFAAGGRLVCGYCDYAGRAREFLAEHVYDTVTNEVYLVARVA